MSVSRDLDSLINNARTTDALVRHYERTLRRVIDQLAAGVSRPGAARAAKLTRQLNEQINRLDPKRSKFVRDWIRRNVPRAFILGDKAGTRTLRQELKNLADAPAKEAFGDVRQGFTANNNAALRGITRAMEATLGKAAEDMRAAMGTTIRETQVRLLQSQKIREATVGGRIRGATGKEVADDIASILLGKKVKPSVRKRLREIGFTGRDFENFEQVARGTVIQVGRKRMNVRDYSDLVATTQMREAHKVGSIVRLQQNGIDHVKISRHQQKVKDECTPYAGKVFYIGALAKDPEGFPKLSETPNGGPPFHPRCRHVVQAFVLPFRGKSATEKAKESAKALPRRFFGKTAAEIRKLVASTPLDELREIAAEGAADIREEAA